MAYGKRNFNQTVAVDRSNGDVSSEPKGKKQKLDKLATAKGTTYNQQLCDKFMDKFLSEETIKSAVEALHKKTDQQTSKKSKKRGVDADDIETDNISYFVIVTTKTHPKKNCLRPHSIPLKHSLTKKDSEVMLIVKDPQRAVKDYLEKHGNGGVTRVLGVEKLRKRYSTFESRRDLLAMYDRFLVDKRVATVMPRILGKPFIAAKKLPLTVNLDHDVTAAIKRALSSTEFTPRRGTSATIRIGTHSMTAEQIYENIDSALRGVIPKLDVGPAIIQSINIKVDKSPALPVFTSLPKAINQGKKKQGANGEIEEGNKESEKSSAEELIGNEKEMKEDEGNTTDPELDGGKSNKTAKSPKKGKSPRSKMNKKTTEKVGTDENVDANSEEGKKPTKSPKRNKSPTTPKGKTNRNPPTENGNTDKAMKESEGNTSEFVSDEGMVKKTAKSPKKSDNTKSPKTPQSKGNNKPKQNPTMSAGGDDEDKEVDNSESTAGTEDGKDKKPAKSPKKGKSPRTPRGKLNKKVEQASPVSPGGNGVAEDKENAEGKTEHGKKKTPKRNRTSALGVNKEQNENKASPKFSIKKSPGIQKKKSSKSPS